MKQVERIIVMASNLELNNNPDVAGKSLAQIVSFLLKRIPEHNRPNAIRKMIVKLRLLNSQQIADKDMRPYTSMGQSISLVKNILAGYKPDFIRHTIDAIIRHLIY